MKSILITLFALAAAKSYAATELVCQVNERVNPPLEIRSVDYTVTAKLNPTDSNARIDIKSNNFPISFSVISFKSTLTSPGAQVVIIDLENLSTGESFTTDGHGFASSTYDTNSGMLDIECSVK